MSSPIAGKHYKVIENLIHSKYMINGAYPDQAGAREYLKCDPTSSQKIVVPMGSIVKCVDGGNRYVFETEEGYRFLLMRGGKDGWNKCVLEHPVRHPDDPMQLTYDDALKVLSGRMRSLANRVALDLKERLQGWNADDPPIEITVTTPKFSNKRHGQIGRHLAMVDIEEVYLISEWSASTDGQTGFEHAGVDEDDIEYIVFSAIRTDPTLKLLSRPTQIVRASEPIVGGVVMPSFEVTLLPEAMADLQKIADKTIPWWERSDLDESLDREIKKMLAGWHS